MNVLLTNDDGYKSDGIQLLKENLKNRHKVFVCAPAIQMSAVSHAITLGKKIEFIKIDDGYALYGTPADCVKIALIHFYKDIKIDLVVSGINHGANMGIDVFYSGTVAAAREGLMNGIFSIAASVDTNDFYNSPKNSFLYPAKYLSDFIDRLNEKILKSNTLLNINFPNIENVKGAKITTLGDRFYKDFVIETYSDGKSYVQLDGEAPGFNPVEGSDLNTVADGYISITPLSNDIYHSDIKHLLEKII